MLTQKQEEYLGRLADKGIAEEKEQSDRTEQIELETVNNAARDAKLAELRAAAQKLIDDGLEEFEATLPTELP